MALEPPRPQPRGFGAGVADLGLGRRTRGGHCGVRTTFGSLPTDALDRGYFRDRGRDGVGPRRSLEWSRWEFEAR